VKTEHLFPNRQFARQRWAFRKILEVIKLVIGIVLKFKKKIFLCKGASGGSYVSCSTRVILSRLVPARGLNNNIGGFQQVDEI
jgi:hypothetical protein